MQVTIAHHLQLRLLCWNRPGDAVLDGPTALAVYENGWRHVDEAALAPEEWALVGELAARFGGGVLLPEGAAPVNIPGPVPAPGPVLAPGQDQRRRSHEPPQNRHVVAVLRALDAELLERAQCFLGGGVAVVLTLGGYRAVRGIRLLCASEDGYRFVRRCVHEAGLDALLRVPGSLKVVREVRAGPHGLRAAVAVDGEPVRINVARETHMRLSGAPHLMLGVPVLCRADLFCERLLANADRHADQGADDPALGGAAVDLAMMKAAWGPVPVEAWAKARRTYGELVDEAYARAMADLRDPGRLRRRIEALGMDPSLGETLPVAQEGPPHAPG